MIDFSCVCGFKSRAKDELAGKKVKCPNCGRVVVLPMISANQLIPVNKADLTAPKRKPFFPIILAVVAVASGAIGAGLSIIMQTPTQSLSNTGDMVAIGERSALEQELEDLKVQVSVQASRIIQLEQTNRQLRDIMDTGAKEKAVTTIPMIGNETPLTRVEANTQDYIQRIFIVVGGITIRDYYNFGYSAAKDTHVSLRLDEIRADRSSTRKSIAVYLRREWSQSLVDVITESVGKGFRGKLIRAKLAILADRYKDNADTAELLDWQFLEKDQNTWSPWVLGRTSKD